MARIHSLSAVDENAVLADDVEIGPFSVIGPDVVMGEGCRIDSHVVISGHTTLGTNNHIYPFSVLGESPQDLKYKGEVTRLVIGSNNVIRESVVIHRGTVQGGGVTTIGDKNLLMAHTHVAHDCHIANGVVLANYSALAGHVTLDDGSCISGKNGVSQHCYVGKYVFTAGMSKIAKSVPSFVRVRGNPATACGINTVGLQRNGYSEDSIVTLRRACRQVFSMSSTIGDSLSELKALAEGDPVLSEFVASIVRCQQATGMVRKGKQKDAEV